MVNISATPAEAADSGTPAVLAALTKGGLVAPESYDGLGGRLSPLGRVSDVVDRLLFLESSPYITGEVLCIDGGQIASR